jgi:hypothetical protein
MEKNIALFYAQILWMANYYQPPILHALVSLKATSFAVDMVKIVLSSFSFNGKLPDWKRVWPSEDDKVLMKSNDLNGIMQLRNKHGIAECR